jgi:hypothetical protein
LRRFGGVSEARSAEREPAAEILSAAKDLSRQTARRLGGASRDRTDDLIVANDALSQLSYSPMRQLVAAKVFYQFLLFELFLFEGG